MLTEVQTNSRILAEYRQRTPGSAQWAEAARQTFPSGITHDARQMWPYGIYVDRAEGSRKWDVDSNEYVDYFGGHGALLLGHNHPKIIAAVRDTLARGTHFGANHVAEVRWGQGVQALLPSAERVRFTASGTEATHLAVRLARAHTGRSRLVRFRMHFHGWNDHMTSGFSNHFDGSPTPGVVKGVADDVLLLPPGDVGALKDAFATHGDIAAVVVEPTGGTFGRVPIEPEFLAVLREVTAKAGTILIFDEVITGFRVSPGGAQGEFGITPDLTTLAKILAGGLPGGALAGRADILEHLDFEVAEQKGFEKVQHPGTFNANPLSAAAGATALDIIRSEPICRTANDYAAELRDRLNAELRAAGVPWAVYGTFSGFHIFLNPDRRSVDVSFDALRVPPDELKATPRPLADKLRLALLINGIDLGGWMGGLVSAQHGEPEMRDTVAGFSRALAMLKDEGEMR
jgi:glutamate-1-semialdehyde 2,1-aminomutase